MASTAAIPLYARVRVSAGLGTVRFVGQTSFAAGKWVGIELDEDGTGKNDGTVQGKWYFDCEKQGSLSGVFVRPSQVHILEEADADGAAAAAGTPPRAVLRASTLKDPDGFAVPAPPKPPSTPAAADNAAARRLSARPSAGGATHLSTPSTSRPASRAVASASTSGTPARPSIRPGGSVSRLSSTSSGTSASSSRRTSEVPLPTTTASTPSRKPSLSANPSSSALPGRNAPNTPRPSSSASARSAAGTAIPTPGLRRSTTPRSETVVSPAPPTSESMSRQVSSVSSRSQHSQPASRGMSRTASLRELLQQEKDRGLPRTPSNRTAGQADDQRDEEVSPTQQASSQRASLLPADEIVEEKRASLRSLTDVDSLADGPAKAISTRAFDELQLKYKLLEAGRAEDRERLKELERLKEDNEAWQLARPKLQGKLVELSAEVKDLRRQSREHAAERDTWEKRLEEVHDQLELAALDRETAEEKLEQCQAELDAVTDKKAEVEVELEVLKKEEERIVAEAGGQAAGSRQGGESGQEDSQKTSLAFIQLAKQNDRLKEALVRLRDISSENDGEHKRRIADLEKELDLTSELQDEYDLATQQLEKAEEMVENLKLQLDDAMGAEDMLEHLTERNLTLSERIEEMHAVIQDLEALKELNDELEENHVENEKQMQEEIDLKEYQLRESRLQSQTLEDSLLDYETTISQFRELVVSLQGDIETLREQTATAQTESKALSSQSQAMLNLNMKLKNTALKNQAKSIELEIRKLEESQAKMQLGMITPYLLPAFIQDDEAAVNALLFFSRLASKSSILLGSIDQIHSLADAAGTLPEPVPETLVAVCEARFKIARFMVLCKRFTVNLQRCAPKTFIKMGKVFVELVAFEKRLDSYIELAKKEELREAECGLEVDRFTAQAAHVAEIHLGELDLDLGEQQLGQLLSIDLDLDVFIAGVSFAKQIVMQLSQDADVVLETDNETLEEAIFSRLQALLESARAVKGLSRKLARRAEEVSDAGGYLRAEVSENFQASSVNMHSIAGFASKLSDLMSRYALEIRATKEPFQLSTYLGITQEAAADVRSQSKDILGVEVVLRNLQAALHHAVPLALDADNVVKGLYEAPWMARVTDLQRDAARDEDAERKVGKMTEDIKDLAREIRLKDQVIQETSVKIELLEKRAEAVKKQADTMVELESELTKVKKQEVDYEATIEQLQGDLDELERENTKLKRAVPSEKNANGPYNATEYTTFTGSLETSHLIEQIESLQGAVRYLKQQNTLLKSKELLKDYNQLPTYDTAVATKSSERARSFQAESYALFKEVAAFSSRARVVDISKVDTSKSWQSSDRKPSAQLAAKKAALEKLKAKIDKLTEDRRALAHTASRPA